MATVLLAGFGAVAATPDNPYRVIAEKNAFRLNPPPPPPTNAPPQVEEKTNLRFTGLSWDGPNVSAWLVIDSLEPGGTSTYLSLAPGVKSEGVEVLSIDEQAQKVKVAYRGKDLNLGMETAASAPVVPGARPIPGVPNAPRPGVRPTAAIPGVNMNNSPIANPTGGNRMGGGVAPAIPQVPTFNSQGGMPQRTLRTTGGGASAVANPSPIANPRNNSAAAAPLSAVESEIMVEAARMTQPANFPPLPPTSINPTGQ